MTSLCKDVYGDVCGLAFDLEKHGVPVETSMYDADEMLGLGEYMRLVDLRDDLEAALERLAEAET